MFVCSDHTMPHIQESKDGRGYIDFNLDVLDDVTEFLYREGPCRCHVLAIEAERNSPRSLSVMLYGFQVGFGGIERVEAGSLWRREWDSNPRGADRPHLISNQRR